MEEEDVEEMISYLLAGESLRKSRHPWRLLKTFLILRTHNTPASMSCQEDAEGGGRDQDDHWWTKVQNTESAIWKNSSHIEISRKGGRVFWKGAEEKKKDV